jgi:hypothetical protein
VESGEIHLPVNTYRIIDPIPEKPNEELAEPSPAIHVNAEVEEPAAAAEAPVPRPPILPVILERLNKFAESPKRVYITLGASLAVMVLLTIATFYWPTNPHDGPYDLESVTSDAFGLEGHLYAKWDKQLQYRLTLHASDPDQRAGFALVAANPPRPLSIGIQLKDNQGFVLCSKEILLKFDARKAAAVAASEEELQTESPDTAVSSANPPTTVADFARLDAQEAAREQGQDIFWNQYGSDGKVAAINAEGVLPCSRKAYQITSFWSLLPNFPSIAEQGELLKRQEEFQAEGAITTEAPPAFRVRQKAVAKAPAKLLSFAVEGDDSIEEFDLTHGLIETRGRKTFYFDKSSILVNDAGWQDYPVSIHYRCDQNANCALTHTGIGVLRARIRK